MILARPTAHSLARLRLAALARRTYIILSMNHFSQRLTDSFLF
jgi:hypothetical protein